ncbi:hypothetical protein SDC9_46723 [bioreactor metagenome]|uniref:Transglutaminase-like domain-containing protein n=1 Tax=bioreactor metagenome TaxID=1076179 RepID=A0A644WAF9_9ZZZZ
MRGGGPIKNRLIVILLAAALVLSPGCTSMLNRERTSVESHNQFSDTGSDASVLRAENYQGLVNAVLYLVSQGAEEGIIRLYNYTGDVDTDLNGACLEVAKEDPLGAYAVDYIKSNYTRIVSYYEATVEISYRRTTEQIKSVVSVTGSSAIKDELSRALSVFSPQVVLRINYFTEDESYITGLINQTYYNTPESAFSLPQVTISLYPDSGTQRIVEIDLSYPGGDAESLLAKQAKLLAAADKLIAQVNDIPPTKQSQALFSLLRKETRYTLSDEAILNTTYAALLGGKADSEGMALALQLLYARSGIDSVIVRGTLDGELHFWNIVKTLDGMRHADATRTDGFSLTDSAMNKAGYSWDTSAYPACQEQTAISENIT